LWRTLMGAYALAALAAGVLASGGGLWLSRMYLRKLESFAANARAVTAGDFARRMPTMRSGDEFDSLSQSLNLMLDRNKELLERQRQITNDIAHDIRTPLTRLRQKLEAALGKKGQLRLPAAIEDMDEILDILDSLLRIAEIEEGARKRNFKTIDLNAIARKVEEIYAPSFEDQHKVLSLTADPFVNIKGDADLITQLLVNLLENALHHTPTGTQVTISVKTEQNGVQICIMDDGPGVPPGEERKILDRFYRLDRSRSTFGTGLGLYLVKAIAELHDATLTVANRSPGLAITVTLPICIPQKGEMGGENTKHKNSSVIR
jgi:signal transduction histidine kinase